MNKKQNNDESFLWASSTDLMTGLMVIFLFISTLIMISAQKQKEELENMKGQLKIAQDQFKDAQKKFASQNGLNIKTNNDIKDLIGENFSEYEIGLYGISDKGDINKLGDFVKFESNESTLSKESKEILRDIFIRYIPLMHKVDEKNDKDILEIRIEGHTSSAWEIGSNENTFVNTKDEIKYINNLKLSQDRSRKIVDFILSIPELKAERAWIREKVTANGLSSSNTIKKADGTEDRDASRRINVKVKTKSISIDDLLNNLGGNNK